MATEKKYECSLACSSVELKTSHSQACAKKKNIDLRNFCLIRQTLKIKQLLYFINSAPYKEVKSHSKMMEL